MHFLFRLQTENLDLYDILLSKKFGFLHSVVQYSDVFIYKFFL